MARCATSCSRLQSRNLRPATRRGSCGQPRSPLGLRAGAAAFGRGLIAPLCVADEEHRDGGHRLHSAARSSTGLWPRSNRGLGQAFR